MTNSNESGKNTDAAKDARIAELETALHFYARNIIRRLSNGECAIMTPIEHDCGDLARNLLSKTHQYGEEFEFIYDDAYAAQYLRGREDMQNEIISKLGTYDANKCAQIAASIPVSK